MYIAYRWISRDLGKAETILSIILISVFLGIMVNKSLQLFALAERRLVQVSIVNMQTALRLQVAIQSLGERATSHKISEGMNPVVLVQSEPDDYEAYLGTSLDYVRARQYSIKPLNNYLGEMYDPDVDSLERGNWYFDHKGKVLVYLFEHGELFSNEQHSSSELRYRVHLRYEDLDKNRRYEYGSDRLISASLVKVDTN